MRFDTYDTGKRIKAIREKMGMTQLEFAEMFRTTSNYISKIELGYKTPSIELLCEIAVETKTPTDILLLGTLIQESTTSKEEVKENIHSLVAALLKFEKEL